MLLLSALALRSHCNDAACHATVDLTASKSMSSRLFSNRPSIPPSTIMFCPVTCPDHTGLATTKTWFAMSSGVATLRSGVLSETEVHVNVVSETGTCMSDDLTMPEPHRLCLGFVKPAGPWVSPSNLYDALQWSGFLNASKRDRTDLPGLMQFTRPKGAILTISFFSESMMPPIIADFDAA